MIDFFQQPANLILLHAIGQLLIIGAIGYLAVRIRLLSAKTIECLSRFVLVISLPCLVISTLAKEMRFDLLEEMGLCLVAALLLNGLGLAAAFLARRLFLPSSQPDRRPFLTLASLQNSGYLPIPLTNAILPESQRDIGLLFVFVYILVMGFLFWSLGVWLIARRESSTNRLENLRRMANPPMLAMLIGLVFLVPQVKAGLAALPLLKQGIQTVGDTTIPLVLIILGGSFTNHVAKSGNARLVVGVAAVMKLIFIPALALSAAVFLEFEPVFAFAFVLQAAMPAAMNHIVVAREYNGNVPLVSRALFSQYLLALVTVPIFLLIFNGFYL